MFLRNYWYVAAYDREITRRPLGRIILGEPIVFYRLEDGTPVALEDRCAHRHLPLSMGKLVGDTLQCHYHGLRYDKTGACVRVPGLVCYGQRNVIRSKLAGSRVPAAGNDHQQTGAGLVIHQSGTAGPEKLVQRPIDEPRNLSPLRHCSAAPQARRSMCRLR